MCKNRSLSENAAAQQIQAPSSRHSVATNSSLIHPSKAVDVPSIEVIRKLALGSLVWCSLSIVGCTRGYISTQLNVKSQLVILHLRRLQQSTNLHSAFTLLFFSSLGCLLALFGEQLCIVARELLQRDQEVTKDDLEAIEIGVGCEKSVNERSDLNTVYVSLMSIALEIFHHIPLEIGEGSGEKVANKITQELPV